MTDCVYLGEKPNGEAACHVHGKCLPDGDGTGLASCKTCKERLPPDAKDFAERFLDPLHVTDRGNKPTHALRNLLAGRAAFLVCGGPSANDLPLEELNRRGCWSLTVNNMAGHPRFRPQAAVFADPLSKFHHGIWLDPSIMKFVPTPKLKRRRGRLRRKRADGEFEPLVVVDGKHLSACDCPNVWGFGRRAWLVPDDTFFLEKEAAWGNHDAGTVRTGQPKTVCTMLLGLRLLYHLGARRVFLVGVDFRMDPSLGLDGNYAFGEARDGGAVRSNNAQFKVAGEWLCELQRSGTFGRFGLEMYNCNGRSGLRAFEHVPFMLAVRDATTGIPEGDFDLRNWYSR